MLHRTKKEKDINKGKWIGVGGKMEQGETVFECVSRETLEETGLTFSDYNYLGIIKFFMPNEDQFIYTYTSTNVSGDLKECIEGDLEWVDIDKVMELPMWEGDHIFMPEVLKNQYFGVMEFYYDENDNLLKVVK